MQSVPDPGHSPAAPHRRQATTSLMSFRDLFVLTAAYAVLLALLALYTPGADFLWLFSEQGPFEILSIGFWLLLAALCFSLPGLPRRPWGSGIVAMVAAAREADLHKAFTTDSLFKTHYYLKSAAPLLEKLVAGVVALLALAAVVYVLVAGARYIRRTEAWRHDWGKTVLYGIVLLVASKLLDRMEAVTADWFGLHFPLMLHRFVAAFEEGVECLLPVLFIAALLGYQYLNLSSASATPPGADTDAALAANTRS